MARVWSQRPLFHSKDPFPGANKRTAHSLSLINDSPAAARVEDALRKLRIAYKKPFWKHDIWAHVGIPRLRICIMVVEVNDRARMERFRNLWKGHHFLMFYVRTSDMDKLTDAEIADSLRSAIKEVRGTRQ